MKSPFYVTAHAGKEVSGVRNPGVGQTLMLTAEQAAHPLRQRHISRTPPVVEAPEDQPTKAASAKTRDR